MKDEALKCDEISYDYRREWLKFNEIGYDYRWDCLNYPSATLTRKNTGFPNFEFSPYLDLWICGNCSQAHCKISFVLIWENIHF